MISMDSLSERMIRFFIYPFARMQPVDYGIGIRQARQIMISCPEPALTAQHSKQLCEFIDLFPNAQRIILINDVENRLPENARLQILLNNPITFTDMYQPSIWRLIQSKTLKSFADKKIDLFIDLDPALNLVNLYLCRLLRPTIRIAFSKPFSREYYNLEYDGKTDKNFTDKMKNLLDFIMRLSED